MKPIYNYQPYPTPKVGLFSVNKTPSEYRLPGGWVQEEKEHTIIGETDEHYITELKPTKTGFWEDDKRWTERYLLPLGPHKSRLVKWVAGQLQMF